MAWDQSYEIETGLAAHWMINSDIIIWIGDSDYTVCSGSTPLANFIDLHEARAFAEELETWHETQKEEA